MADRTLKKKKSSGLRALLGLRSSKEPGTRTKLTKKSVVADVPHDAADEKLPEPPRRHDDDASFYTESARRPDEVLDKNTGERKDLTEMMHAFTYNEEPDSGDEALAHGDDGEPEFDPSRPDGTPMLAALAPELWLHLAETYLSALDVARLATTCRTLYARLGGRAYMLLQDPEHRAARVEFLLALDRKMPRHLFCFPCAQWHLRIQPGCERLRPHHVVNPLFECPNRMNHLCPPPRLRLTEGRTLPFTFAQLARRHWAFGPAYGIPHQDLARRWKDPYSDWSHNTMYHITDRGHLLVRVKSQVHVEGGLTDAAKRILLFSRGDYTPYFSVCSHWKTGLLTSVPKCALDHIPVDKTNTLSVPTCARCKPIRRCFACPTEYLFELKMAEDKTVQANGPQRFKLALMVSRWSDLGPAQSPDDKEWAAIVSQTNYDSLQEMGKRSINGTFESAFTDAVPGKRIMSTNPKNIKPEQTGSDWY